MAFCAGVLSVKAQFQFTGQLRTRTEWRNGVGTLRAYNADPSFFTSQRTRLSFGYNAARVQFKTTVQDVRVWGQDASSISNADGAKLGVHEACAEIVLQNRADTGFKSAFVDYLGLKIGRQELMYDDARLLGNLDWLQQGRRHDALVFKMREKKFSADAGFAFSQQTDAFGYNGTYYTPANVLPTIRDSKGNLVATPAGFIPLVNAGGISSKTGAPVFSNPPGTNGQSQQYKAMQFLYASWKKSSTTISGLVLADHFGIHQLDSVQNISGTDTGYVFGRKFRSKGVHSRLSFGTQLSGSFDKKNTLLYKGGLYYQTGKDREGTKLSAYMAYASLTFQRTPFAYSIGYDLLSGNDAFSSDGKNHRFDPLYGTPHKFWGYMDYFYVGTGSPTGGLSNPQASVRYTAPGKRFSASADYHAFFLANDQKDKNASKVERYLGSEVDLSSSYQLNNIVTLEGGVSFMGATRSMEYAKNISPGTACLAGSWAWLMVNIRPDFLRK